jgi:carboxypeptidase Q
VRLLALAAAAVLTLYVPPASAQEAVDRAMSARIRAEGLERSQAGPLMYALVDGIGGRLTGSPSHLAAVRWAQERFAAWGLRNVQAEPFPFGRGWSLDHLTLEMMAPRFLPLSGHPEAWTPSTKGVVSGRVVYVGDKTLDQVEALGAQLSGAIVLTHLPQTAFIEGDRPQPATSSDPVRIGNPAGVPTRSTTPLQQLMPVLQRAGAGVVLRPSNGKNGTVFVTGNRATRDDAVPSIVLEAEHYNMLARLAAAGAPPELNVEVRARYQTQDTMSYNVVAEIPGTDPAVRDEIVLISAHLDSWHASNGATDNGDGVIGVMEAMRILAALDARPRRTIRVALWSGEEQGLLGARAHLARHFAAEPGRSRLSVMMNDDPGLGRVLGFFMQNNERAKPIFDAWLQPLTDLGAIRNIPEGIGNTDHVPFDEAGLPAFTAVKDYAAYDSRSRHGNGDFPEYVKVEDLQQSAIVMATFAWHAAMREGSFPRPAVPRD